jgi:hypothetical protein
VSARSDLLLACDRFLEAAGSVAAVRRRAEALAPVQATLESELARIFDAQGKAVLKRLRALKDQWPVSEAVSEADLAAVLADDQATRDELAAALAVAIALAWELGVDGLTAELEQADELDPLALAGTEYLTTRGRVAADQIADTTRDQIGRVLVLGLAAGWLLSALVDAVTARFVRYQETRIPGISQYETLQAYSEGSYNAAGYYSATGIPVEKLWVTMRDGKVERICRENETQSWLPAEQTFSSGHQKPLAHHRCLPGYVRVLARGVLATTDRWYDGYLVIIHTASDHELAVTPNHPILTPGGWIAAGLLNEGDYIVSSSGAEWKASGVNPDNQNVPTRIEDVAETFRSSTEVLARPVPTASEDFDGDGVGSKVAVVRANRLLWDGHDAALAEQVGKFGLGGADAEALQLNRLSPSQSRLDARHDALGSSVRGGNLASALLIGHPLPLQGFGLALTANVDSGLGQVKTDSSSLDSEPLGDSVLGLTRLVEIHDLSNGQRDAAMAEVASPSAVDGDPAIYQASFDSGVGNATLTSQEANGCAGQVFLDEIINIERRAFHGLVYNLQTESGWYAAEGIITHNCRCLLGWRAAKTPKEQSDWIPPY